MRGDWQIRQARLATLAILAMLGASMPGLAQQTPPFSAAFPAGTVPFQSPVLVIDPERLFTDSAYGQATIRALETDSRALQAEIRKIESDLEIEERLLTERRQSLSPAEFAPLGRAFDEKVEGIRASWGAKDRELSRQREELQQVFYNNIGPILIDVMREMGAVMLVDKSSVIIKLDRADITQIAIDRINARFPDIPAPEPVATPEPETPRP